MIKDNNTAKREAAEAAAWERHRAAAEEAGPAYWAKVEEQWEKFQEERAAIKSMKETDQCPK